MHLWFVQTATSGEETPPQDRLFLTCLFAEAALEPSSVEACPFRGGESEALARLDRHMRRQAWVAAFEKPKTEPNSLEPSTTVLSPYLKFGCLSPRRFWHALEEVYQREGRRSQPPVSLHGQLLWREFFTSCGYATPNFDRMEGNPICRQIGSSCVASRLQ